ncbi:MAG TPA: XrtA-associated tyrosine autokinase [Rhodocyclaceae bacterium]|nr:XrtA-associated tyrosine autokinase [Rhodocyclaceae bacterium]
MSLIERAVERLDQLRQAGADTSPESGTREAPASTAAAPSKLAEETAEPDARAAEALPKTHSKLVEIDIERLGKLGFITPRLPRSTIADEFRVIKRPLLQNAEGRSAAQAENANLIMITSALPGEGKSFTAINLAISMAMELDHTVLLVDADVSRPSVLSTLALAPEKGLMDLLTGEVSDPSDVMLRTNIEKLSILPAGTPHQRATEFLASEAMNGLLQEMAKRYSERVIVFDSPPLLATTEARVLATHMGQVVLVVESERTPQSSVRHALGTIESCPIKLMVLNKSREKALRAYGYAYGYGYGYGYGRNDRKEARADMA